jgi:diaminopimelate epimerase
MSFAIVYKNRVIVGPMAWNQKYFTSVLKIRHKIDANIAGVEPEVFPVILDANTSMENKPDINLMTHHHYGPLWDLSQDIIVANYEVKENGSKIRYSDLYGKEGSNINFVEQLETDKFAVRTYERGVEDETLSCGTGVTAVAIAMFQNNKTQSNAINLKVEGGDLKVTFEVNPSKFTNVFLIGSATFVFEGAIEITL